MVKGQKRKKGVKGAKLDKIFAKGDLEGKEPGAEEIKNDNRAKPKTATAAFKNQVEKCLQQAKAATDSWEEEKKQLAEMQCKIDECFVEDMELAASRVVQHTQEMNEIKDGAEMTEKPALMKAGWKNAIQELEDMIGVCSKARASKARKKQRVPG